MTAFASSPPFDVPIVVDAADIDFMDLNNAAYLKWVQHAVIEHWRRFASVEDVARHLWLATKGSVAKRRGGHRRPDDSRRQLV